MEEAGPLTTSRPFALDDQTVVVTGASGGIGAAIALAFSQCGATVVVHYRSDEAGAEVVAARLRASGGKALVAGGDLSDPSSARSLIAAAVEQTGRLDVLVNNAGVQPVETLAEMGWDHWRAVVDSNLHATFLCSAEASKAMLARGCGGSIIHIASIEASQPAFGHAHYSASKAAVLMHARAAALELGPHGIRVNCVSPGLVRRDGLEQAWPEGVERYTAAAPLHRLIDPAEVAAACLFLASPLAAAITGHDLVVDAGVSCHPTW